MDSRTCFAVFTKPWKMPLPQLGKFVRRLGFDAIELPVRPGYQVEPEQVERGLPEAVSILREQGVEVASVAGPTDERTIAACGRAGIPIIRICVQIPENTNYLAAVSDYQRQWDELVPVLERHRVAIGVQNHCDRFIANAMQLHHAIQKFDPRHFAAVWDPAHCAINGEIPELALDIVQSHLRMVNLKNAMWQSKVSAQTHRSVWEHVWVTGSAGLADWRRVAQLLHQRGWRGPICLTAEYTDHAAVDQLIAQDIAFAKSCFVGNDSGSRN